MQCDAMKTMRSKAALDEQMQKGIVAFCVSGDAMQRKKQRNRKQRWKNNADENAWVVISWVVPLIAVAGKSGTSASGRVRCPEMLARKVVASLWSSGYWLARAVMVVASPARVRVRRLDSSP